MRKARYINANGKLLDLSTPCVMGILNATPDSFYAGSRMQTEAQIARRVEQMAQEGAGIMDVGAYSSRPGAADVSAKEEMERLRTALGVVRRLQPDAIVSVDTFRADVARMCVEEYGAAIINDISGGELDKDMSATVARLQVPYVLMHMQGTPQDMQQRPHYDSLLEDVFLYFARKVQQLRDLGVKDIILDPGFGFGKTLEHNYELFKHLDDAYSKIEMYKKDPAKYSSLKSHIDMEWLFPAKVVVSNDTGLFTESQIAEIKTNFKTYVRTLGIQYIKEFTSIEPFLNGL